MATVAEKVFARIVGDEEFAQPDAEAELRKFIDEKHVESDYLEYKSAHLITSDKTRLHWSKALSAFANAGGGLLIWGVQCKKMKDPTTGLDLDEPTGFLLAPNANELAADLKDWLVTATTDPVEGVKIRTVTFGKGPDGCVLCLIPEGQNRPYQSMFADRRYYIRAPDRMQEVTHSLLRVLFYPRVAPKLQISIACYAPGVDDLNTTESTLAFDISVKNIGKATAHGTFIHFELEQEMKPNSVYAEWKDKSKRTYQSHEPRFDFTYLGLEPIHPMLEMNLQDLRWRGNLGRRMFKPFKFTFNVFLNDGEAKKYVAEIGERALLERHHVAIAKEVE